MNWKRTLQIAIISVAGLCGSEPAVAAWVQTTGVINVLYSADRVRNCYFASVNGSWFAVPTSEPNYRSMVNTIMLARALGSPLTIHYDNTDYANCGDGAVTSYFRIGYVGF